MRFYLREDLNIDDDGKLYRKFSNKSVNAKKENIPFLLTFDDFCTLLKDAGITSSQLGFTGDNYVLARYGDKGNYEVGNCRFITQIENAKERTVTDKSREASRNNVAKMNQQNALLSTDELGNRIKNSPKYRAYAELRKAQAEEHRKVLDAQKNPSYTGNKNSQYGTYWITNGINNTKWADNKGSIPDGWRRGRVTKP